MIWLFFIAIMAATMPGAGTKGRSVGDMLPLLKRHEIQVLLDAGFAPTDEAQRTGTSVDSVRRVRREQRVEETDDRAERGARGIGRPKAAPFTDRVSKWLDAEPTLPTQELLRRAKEVGYPGSKTAFYALVAALRPPRAAPVVRFEGLPGEFSQHDFGQVDVSYVDGRTQRIRFFASRLKYSRFVAVTLVRDERVETLVRCLARDFVTFGGLPLMAVFDRPRTIVKKGGKRRDVEQFNPTFAQAIVDIGVGVEMCAPRSGNEKGSVERLVGWVKGSFFNPRKFQDEGDLRAQLAAWLIEVNTKTARAIGVIPETRRREELARLRAVRVLPKYRAAFSHLRRSHGRGDVRRCAVLDAPRRDARRRHALPLRRPRPHRGRPIRIHAAAALQGRPSGAAARASRREDRRRARRSREALPEAPGLARPRARRARSSPRSPIAPRAARSALSVNDRHIKRRAMIFTTNQHPKRWGAALHDDDLAEAIVDRILERGRLLRLDGPSVRTKHLPGDELADDDRVDSLSSKISGTKAAEFPEPSATVSVNPSNRIISGHPRLLLMMNQIGFRASHEPSLVFQSTSNRVELVIIHRAGFGRRGIDGFHSRAQVLPLALRVTDLGPTVRTSSEVE